MGIYGALSTAVTGLRAQSFALENVSGNIANSQTIGFKRIDTDFVDLIPDAAPKRQTSGSVLAQAHSTNNVQGDVKGAATETYMAINGNGFFIVEPRAGQADGVGDVLRRELLHASRRLRARQVGLPRQRRRLLSQGPAHRCGDAEHFRLRAPGSAGFQRVPAGPADHSGQLRAEPAAVAQDAEVPGLPGVRQRVAVCHRFPDHHPGPGGNDDGRGDHRWRRHVHAGLGRATR